MSINNYNFARWYDCGNEDMLDNWNAYGYTGTPALDAIKEREAKELHESYPCEIRKATEEELMKAFPEMKEKRYV